MVHLKAEVLIPINKIEKVVAISLTLILLQAVTFPMEMAIVILVDLALMVVTLRVPKTVNLMCLPIRFVRENTTLINVLNFFKLVLL